MSAGFVSAEVSVGTGNTAILPYNQTRDMLVLSNGGANDIWVTLSNSSTLKAAVVGVGILIPATNGSVTIFPPLCKGGVQGIAETGATDLGYQQA